MAEAISDDVMVRKQLLREVMDALVAVRLDDAATHIAEAERGGREAEAEAHYVATAKRFRGDAARQITLSMSALHTMSGNLAAARAARDSLGEVASNDTIPGRDASCGQCSAGKRRRSTWPAC